MKKTLRTLALTLMISFSAASVEELETIFNEVNLEGWHVVPENTASDWTVKNGLIVGQGSANRLSYLVWDDVNLQDFELELDYRLPGKGNTGIEVHAQADPSGKRPFQGYHADLGHVGIGDHILGAWDFHFAERNEPVCERGTALRIDENDSPTRIDITDAVQLEDINDQGWNHVRVVARGNHFRFFINGKLASEFSDQVHAGRLTAGAIGLQLHDKGMRVEFRNVQLKRLPPETPEGFTRLFNETDFTGWEGNLEFFRLEDGAIVAGRLTERVPQNEFLCTTKEYGDFELRLEVKGSQVDVNGGVQIRSKRIPDHHEVSGYQVDTGTIGANTFRRMSPPGAAEKAHVGTDGQSIIWGSLYDESRRNRFLAIADQIELKKALNPDGWNQFVIRCEGDRIQVWINDAKTVDYVETNPEIADSGIIGVQIHSGPAVEVSYRNIFIRELDESQAGFVESDGLQIYYERFGAGPPMILAHGWGGDTKSNWVDTGWVDALKEHRSIISIDIRGHGKSDKPHELDVYSYAGMSRDVLAVMDELGIPKADYMGYSMGAFMGAHLLGHHSERFTSMVLGGIGNETEESAAACVEIAKALRAPDMASIKNPVGVGYRMYAEANPNNDLESLAFSALKMWPEGYPLKLAGPGIGAAKTRVLVVNGEKDHPYVDSADLFVNAISHGRHVKIPGRDHLSAVADPRFKKHVLQFLTGHEN